MKIFQANLSSSYMLSVEGGPGKWVIAIHGPCQLRDSRPSSTGLAEVKREAYSLARRHLVEKGIGEVPVEFEELIWSAIG